jgi:hypothetical protein
LAACALAAWLDDRDAGMIAGLAAIWLTAAIRKIATGSVPSLLAISALVFTVQAAVVLGTGELWLFLLQFPLANLAMGVLFARTASGPNPLVARLAAEVVALRQPAAPPPRPAPLLPAGNLAVGGHLPATGRRPGGADDDRAGWHVPDAVHRRHYRARGRRNRRIRTMVPHSAAQARAQAPFRPSLSPAAAGSTAYGRPRHRGRRPAPTDTPASAGVADMGLLWMAEAELAAAAPASAAS